MDGIYIWSVSGDPVLGFEPNSISHKLNQQKIHFFTQFTKTFYLSSLLNLIIVYKAPPFTPGQGCWPIIIIIIIIIIVGVIIIIVISIIFVIIVHTWSGVLANGGFLLLRSSRECREPTYVVIIIQPYIKL